MNKYKFLGLGACVVAIVISLFVNDKSIGNNNMTLQTAQAGILDDLAEWYLSEVYDCVSVDEEVTDYEWYVGTVGGAMEKYGAKWKQDIYGNSDDDDYCIAYGKVGSHTETIVSCEDGGSVAHCSDC